MALVYPNQRIASQKAWATVNLSTEALGTTNSDVVDCGGLTLACIALSSLVSTACTYAFKGSPDSSDALQALVSSTGGRLIYGSTLTNPQSQTLVFDPALFVAMKYLQLVSFTTGAAAPNATGALARLGFAALGEIR